MRSRTTNALSRSLSREGESPMSILKKLKTSVHYGCDQKAVRDVRSFMKVVLLIGAMVLVNNHSSYLSGSSRSAGKNSVLGKEIQVAKLKNLYSGGLSTDSLRAIIFPGLTVMENLEMRPFRKMC